MEDGNMASINPAFVADDIDDDVAANTANQIDLSEAVGENGESTEDTPIVHTNKLRTFRQILQQRRGLCFALLSAILFSSEDVLMDILAKVLDVFQITFMVSTLTIIGSGVCVFVCKINPPKGRWQWASLVISGTALGLGMPTALLSLKYMEVGSSIAIIYTMPIFTGMFAWIILKEPLRLIHMLFIAISFVGIILIAQPKFIFGSSQQEEENHDENLLLGTIFGLASAVSFALLIVVSRKQTGMGMHLLVLMFYNGITTSTINAITCTISQAWQLPSLVNWFEIIGFAAVDFMAQVAIITALLWETAILVSITTTSEVVFAFIWQITIFRVYPDWKTGIGAVLIVSTCVGIAISSSEPDQEADTEDIESNETSNKVEKDIPRNVDEIITVKRRMSITVKEEIYTQLV